MFDSENKIWYNNYRKRGKIRMSKKNCPRRKKRYDKESLQRTTEKKTCSC